MTFPAWDGPSHRYDQEGPLTIEPLVADGERVLDLGCGTGRAARLLTKRGCHVVGLERDPVAAMAARAWSQRVIVADLDSIDVSEVLSGEQFDVVMAGDVVEHLRDPGRVLIEARRLLRPDGRLLVSVPNITHGSIRLMMLQGGFDYEDSGILDRTHLRFFNRRSITDLLTRSGFRVDRIDTIDAPVWYQGKYDPASLPDGLEAVVEGLDDALAYEFVIECRPASEPSDPGHHSDGPVDGPRSEASEGVVELIRAKDDEIADLRTQLGAVWNDLHVAWARLATIENSRSWRYVQRLRSTIVVLRRRSGRR